MYSLAKIYLGNETTEKLALEYEISPTDSAQLWAKANIQSASSGFFENQRFYGFESNKEKALELEINNTNSLISKLNQLYPNLSIPEISFELIPETVNVTHRNFVHNHAIQDQTAREHELLWTQLNEKLHKIERNLHNVNSKLELPFAEIVYTWNENHIMDIPDSDFSLFKVGSEFGTVYANYSQVGRQVMEIFYANDYEVPPDQIRPSRVLSGATALWFGHTSSNERERLLLARAEAWFAKHKKLFDSAGLKWGDPKLALGKLPVGKLIGLPTALSEHIRFHEKVGRFNRVESVEIS